MTLNKREKIFAGIVAALLVVFAIYWFWPSGGDALEELRGKIASLDKKRIDAPKDTAPVDLDKLLENIKSEKNKSLNQALLLKKDIDRLPALRSRALPSNPVVAKREYQNWLLKLADERLKNVNLTPVEPQPLIDLTEKPNRTIYEKLRFTINCQGTLNDLVRFMFDFYSKGHLQKISSITINPVTNKPDQLVLTIIVEALSLPDSKQTDQLSSEKGNRLKLASADAYSNIIAKRNPFVAYTPPRPPRERGGPPATPAKINPLDFSFLTGIIAANGVPEALIYQRTTDETLKVHEGEEFTIGTVKGKVSRIGDNEIDIEIDGKAHTISLGNSLKM
jgi:hypothetical protein